MKKIIFYTGLGLLLAAPTARGQGIRIMSGTTFKLTGGAYTLVMRNNAGFYNQGALQANDLTLKATGTGTSNIGGGGPLTVGQLQLNKSAGESVTLQSPVNIAQGVYFNSGLLDLNGDNLILSDTAMLVNESPASRVMDNTGGAVQITVNLDAPLAENPGNLGLVITSGATWGNTIIRRSHHAFTGPGGGSSIQRSYEVIPANNTGLNTFLRMYYLDAELNALSESTLDFFRSDNSGATWTNIGSASRNTTQNFVNINGVQTMSLFTLSTTNNPLPVKLSEFNAACMNQKVTLQWRLEQTGDVVFFMVEKSRDGSSWQTAGEKITAVPDEGHTYSFYDAEEPSTYYRLQCISPDGAASWSPVQQVSCDGAGYRFAVLQNPVQENIRLEVQSAIAMDVTAVLSDMQGRVLRSAAMALPAGNSRPVMDVPALSAGMYQLQLHHNGSILWQTKIVKR